MNYQDNADKIKLELTNVKNVTLNHMFFTPKVTSAQGVDFVFPIKHIRSTKNRIPKTLGKHISRTIDLLAHAEDLL
jgi:hypothetical protein